MEDELAKLIEIFCAHGGKFDNMTIGYKEDCGYYCSVINNHSNATVFCPTHLLVDVDDIGVSESGLFITKPENYSNNISFLQAYFSFHFDKELVAKILEEKRQIDSLSEHEKLLLKKIDLPNVIDNMDNELEYVKYRILHTHRVFSESLGKKVIMPFVTFLNHNLEGAAYDVNNNGVAVSGKFCGEMFAHYNMGDVMMLLGDYGFVTDSMFIYSLPMWMKLPNGMTLQINRDVSKFKTVNGQIRWPDVEKKGDVITISWFPMYYKNAPRYPIGFAAYLAQEFNIQAEDVMYTVFRFNLNALLPIAFSLKGSENSYVQMVVSGVERQLELIGGL